MPATRAPDACDAVLDAGLVGLACWTVAYHLCLVTGAGSNVALAGTALVLAMGATAAHLRGRPRSPQRETTSSRVRHHVAHRPRAASVAAAVAAVAAVTAAAAMGLGLWWGVVVTAWLVAALAGTVWGVRCWSTSEPDTGGHLAVGRAESLVVLGWAAALAAFSLVVLRSNPDDLYYVNLSQWVASHGAFPVRDTLFADRVWPMTSYPPVASYDGLTGSVAHLLRVPAGSVVYLVVPPVATAASVLALWRLLRAWRVRWRPVALSAALAFLLLDGTASYATPGNLFVTRLWQGKVILLCLLLPLLLVHALRHVEQPDARRRWWLLAGGVAAVGLSTTAIFLVPLVALAGAAPLARRSPREALVGFTALSAYPLLAGVATLALGGRSADDFAQRRDYRFDPAWFGHQVFLGGALAVVVVLAVLLGPLLVPHPAARLTTAVLLLATGLTFVPGVTRVGYALAGLGPTLWRVSWGCTVAALVGVATVSALRRVRPRALGVGLVVVGALSVLLSGSPVWGPNANADLAAPLHWQRSAESRSVVAWMQSVTAQGARVLAPDEVSITVSSSTTRIYPVAPRDYFMDQLRSEPGFDYAQRLLLVDLVNDAAVPSGGRASVASALSDLGVRAACAYRSQPAVVSMLAAAGMDRALRTATYVCLDTA